MKLKTFIPKDPSGNEESRRVSCPRPISYREGRGRGGGQRWEPGASSALLSATARHPRAYAGGVGGRTHRPCSSHGYHLSAHCGLSPSLPLPHSSSQHCPSPCWTGGEVKPRRAVRLVQVDLLLSGRARIWLCALSLFTWLSCLPVFSQECFWGSSKRRP